MANKRRYLPADERKAHIIDTVMALAAEGNPSEITTAAIAEGMGLTQGALFRHFPSKDAMWEAVMAWAGRSLSERLEMASLGASSAMEALEKIFFAHIAFIAEYPGVPSIFFGELQRSGESSVRDRAKEIMGRYGERLQAIFKKGQADGQFYPECDPAAAASLFVGIIQGLVLQSFLTGSRETIAEKAPGAFTLFKRAILRRDLH